METGGSFAAYQTESSKDLIGFGAGKTNSKAIKTSLRTVV